MIAPADRSHAGAHWAVFATLVVLVATLVGCTSGAATPNPTPAGTSTVQPLAHRPWSSGVWIGGDPSAARVADFANWRGARVDTVTTYPSYKTWAEMADSDWSISVWDGFAGKLVYGLPLLPDQKDASLEQVSTGARDDVYSSIARALVAHGRGDSYVRVGLEANGTWFRWGATAATAASFRTAFRHVVGVMKAVAPDLSFVFDIGCGHPLEGSTDRLAPLTDLYPGDDVVDVVGCDTYDAYSTRATDAAEWAKVLRPTNAPGLADLADFARAHGKEFAIPEWGLTKTQAHGSGDNPYYISAMFGFFRRHAGALAFENYFNEPDDYLESSLWNPTQNPLAAARYAKVWNASK